MPAHKENSQDYSSLKPPVVIDEPGGENGRDYASISTFKQRDEEIITLLPPEAAGEKTVNGEDKERSFKEPEEAFQESAAESLAPPAPSAAAVVEPADNENPNVAFTREKKRKAAAKDKAQLNQDNWLLRNGHLVSYAGIFLFTFVLYFRPYELFPALSGLTSLAFFISIATLIFFIPSQLAVEGNLTARPAEVNYILLLTLLGILTIPIARSPITAWETFNDVFIKIVLMFIVMVNVLRTELRLKGLMWLSIGVGLMLSINAMQLYAAGEFTVEDYRVGVQFGGMFGNPNELALHFILFIPIAFVLGLCTKNPIFRLLYWGAAFLMTAGTVVTFSRGGFLGLIAAMLVLAWKLGRKQRFKVMLLAGIIAVLFIALAPGNYGLRILSIFIPGLDPVGSSNQRSELLKQSIWVTLRNPWGVGMGNFQIGSSHNLVTHNAYTQVSSELGLAGLAIYCLFIVTPFRRLGAMERELFNAEDRSWIYYLAIGIQASIVAYMVGSFFGSFAYNWFVYYPVAYAIALRRIYLTGKEVSEKRIESQAVDSPAPEPA
jgi:O-antigen ligase